MSKIHTVNFTPSEGSVIEIPENVGRVDLDRNTNVAVGSGTLKCGICGTGELKEYVVLKTTRDTENIENAQILGIDLHDDSALWYAISKEEYGGGK